MNKGELEKLLLAYETDVRFPDVSGMEHLDMLLTRTKIEEHKGRLSQEQRARLATADQKLVHQSDQFYVAISQVADLTAWRDKVHAPVSYWWWYLDVLAHAWPCMQPANISD
jgi:hypothetical protein